MMKKKAISKMKTVNLLDGATNMMNGYQLQVLPFKD